MAIVENFWGRKLIIATLDGGLGNQLFQYFYGYAVKKRTGHDVAFDGTYFDNSFAWLPGGPKVRRPEVLTELGLPIQIARPTGLSPRSHYFKMFKWVPFIGAPGLNVMREQGFSFQKSFLNPNDRTLVVGYFQSEKYFNDYSDEIRTAFDQASARFLKPVDQDLAAKSIALHVRLGDYVSDKKANQVHGTMTPEYYIHSISEMKKNAGDKPLLIFSDSPSDARKLLAPALTGTSFEMVADRGLSDLQEFFLMRSCAHHILANSSFSWWAAWASNSKSGIKMAPKQWFTPQSGLDTKDLLPESWLKV